MAESRERPSFLLSQANHESGPHSCRGDCLACFSSDCSTHGQCVGKACNMDAEEISKTGMHTERMHRKSFHSPSMSRALVARMLEHRLRLSHFMCGLRN